MADSRSSCDPSLLSTNAGLVVAQIGEFMDLTFLVPKYFWNYCSENGRQTPRLLREPPLFIITNFFLHNLIFFF
ncbi:hypothetical protein XENTR_v10007153 [Xenopus tropicalis]|nr:hypothetical protein XENTR_v10007153 [Xenopus tropicalis]